MTYVGRLGRRLLAQADANQLIDFPDQRLGPNDVRRHLRTLRSSCGPERIR